MLRDQDNLAPLALEDKRSHTEEVIPEEGHSQEADGSGGGRALQVESSTCKGPEVTECLMHASKGGKVRAAC